MERFGLMGSGKPGNDYFLVSEFFGCVITGVFSIINPTYNAYQVDVPLSNCGATNGAYSGLAQVVQNDTMISGISNATSSIVGEFRRQ